MRKINFLTILIMFTFVNVITWADIKDSVVVVNPIYNSKIVETFSKKSNEFNAKRNFKLAEIYDGFTNAGYGSGFVITNELGEQYVVTNKHVVLYADELTLAAENTDAEIIYIDRTLDLALIKPLNHFEKSFAFYSGELYDGDDVWAAGYPGLLGEPGWQFSKGNITNKEANLEYLDGTNISYLIQHSASIDPGNSGGPLLIKDESSALGYSVIGVNTFSITSRNNTFFSIPTVDVVSFIESALDSQKYINNQEHLQQSLLSSIDLLISEVNNKEPNQRLISSYISNNLIGDIGLDSYYHVLDRSSSSLRTKWKDNFYYNSPINTMRGAIYERLMTLQQSESGMEFVELISIEHNDKWEARTLLIINGKKMEVDWIYNFGLWQINEMDFDSLTLKYEGDDNGKKLDNNFDDISPSYMNLVIPGLTQIQRDEFSGYLYAAAAIGGALLMADSFLEFTGAHQADNSNVGLNSAEFYLGVSCYAGSAIISFLEEVFY